MKIGHNIRTFRANYEPKDYKRINRLNWDITARKVAQKATNKGQDSSAIVIINAAKINEPTCYSGAVIAECKKLGYTPSEPATPDKVLDNLFPF